MTSRDLIHTSVINELVTTRGIFNFAGLSCFDDAAPLPFERIPFDRSGVPLWQMKAIML